MINLAIFISGRLNNYNTCLLPILQHLRKQNLYNMKVFLSINANSKEQNVINDLDDMIGYYYAEPFFYQEDWIKNRLKHNRKYMGSYNQLSCFYNDLNNFKQIEKYEIDNNIKFDVICKMRSDIIFYNINQVVFHKDVPNKLILNNINLESTISAYGLSPPFISDAICFGNKKSMELYCNTYNYIKERDIEYNGLYNHTFEPYLNESLYNFPIYGVPLYRINNPKKPPYTKEEYLDKFVNNSRKFVRKDYNWKYKIHRGNTSNSQLYRPNDNEYINDELYIWKQPWTGLVHHKYINETTSFI
tara:strand:+ start:12321 stop:13226 length:906 start_codon:yes stop_codon:yes gene_type:complete